MQETSDRVERDPGGFHVICNWTDQAIGIIIQLRSKILQQAGEHKPIVVVHDQPIDLAAHRQNDEDSFRFVEHIVGSPTDKAVLERARVGEAFSVVVLASDVDRQRADEKTLMTLFALSGLEQYRTGGGPHVIAEIVGHAGKSVVPKTLAEQFPGKLEILEGAAIRGRIFSHAARAAGGLASLYFRLLSYQAETNEVYTVPVPVNLQKTSFAVAAASVLRQANPSRLVTPVGIRRDHNVSPNPHASNREDALLRPDDQLAMIAYDPPDIEALGRVRPISLPKHETAPRRARDSHQQTEGKESDDPMDTNTRVAPLDEGWAMQGHYVICNWNESAVEIIRELRTEILATSHSETDHSVPIVVLSPKTVDLSVLDSGMDKKLLRDLYFHPGDPTNRRFLEHVNVTAARSVIILSDEAYGDLADSRTLLTLFALREIVEDKLLRESRTRRPGEAQTRTAWPMHVVAEIIDVDNYAKFSRFENESGNAVEILRGESLRTRILSQAARTPGLVEFFTDLLTHAADSNEIYEFPFPDELADPEDALFGQHEGRPFREVAAELLTRVEQLQVLADEPAAEDLIAKCETTTIFRHAGTVELERDSLLCALKGRFEIVPIGIWRGRQIQVNPLPKSMGGPGDELQPGDQLAVISYSSPCVYLYSQAAYERLERWIHGASSVDEEAPASG